jgi:O-antigen/teichoic acid export membrane protein
MLARNVIWNWIGLLVGGTVSFLMTPFLIHALGNFYYGLWILVASVIDYCGMLDLGLTNSMQRFVARYRGANDRNGLNQTLAATLAINLTAGCLVAIGSFTLPSLLAHFFHVRSTDLVFRHTLTLMGLSVAVNFPLKSLAGYLSGMQRFDLKNISTIGIVVVRCIGTVWVLHNNWGIVAVAATTLATSSAALVPGWMFVRMADPKIAIIGHFRWDQVKHLFCFSIFTFFTIIGDYFNFQSDSVVISRYLNVALVTPFAVAFNLLRLYQMVMGSITLPLVTRMIATDARFGNSEKTNNCFLQYTKYISLVAMFGACELILNGRSLIHVWIGKDLENSYSVLVVLSVAFLVDLAQAPSMHLLYSRERHRWMGVWNIAGGLLNVLLSVVLCLRYELIGVALGTVIPMLAVKLLVQPLYVLRITRINIGDYLATSVLRPVVVGVCFLSICHSLSANNLETWSQLALTVIVQVSLFAILAIIVGLTSGERRIVFANARTAVNSLQSA